MYGPGQFAATKSGHASQARAISPIIRWRVRAYKRQQCTCMVRASTPVQSRLMCVQARAIISASLGLCWLKTWEWSGLVHAWSGSVRQYKAGPYVQVRVMHSFVRQHKPRVDMARAVLAWSQPVHLYKAGLCVYKPGPSLVRVWVCAGLKRENGPGLYMHGPGQYASTKPDHVCTSPGHHELSMFSMMLSSNRPSIWSRV